MAGHALKIDSGMSKATAWMQIAIAYLAIEGALWTHGATQQIWYVAASVIIIVLTLASQSRTRALGLGTSGFTGALIVVPLAAVVSAMVLLLAAYMGTLRPLYGASSVFAHMLAYGVWALEQEFILNSFFYNRLEAAIGPTRGAALLAALLFSMAHIPNPVLVPVTFVGGLLLVEAFRRWRNIYPLAIAHAMLGLTLAVSIPDPVMRHMRVGLAFLRFKLQS